MERATKVTEPSRRAGKLPGVGKSRDVLFACPFFKFNPIQNMKCLLRNHLTDTSFVIQHLQRVHFRHPNQCTRCGQTFSTDIDLDAHFQRQLCEIQSFKFDGLTEDQIQQLRRPQRHLTQIERWYSIWDILYPNIPRPDSPYISNPMEEMTGIIRRALRATGGNISAEVPGNNLGQSIVLSLGQLAPSGLGQPIDILQESAVGSSSRQLQAQQPQVSGFVQSLERFFEQTPRHFSRDDEDTGEVDDKNEPPRKRPKVPEIDEEALPCIFHLAHPDIYPPDPTDPKSPCFTVHKEISQLVRHLSRPAHKLKVTSTDISSFEVRFDLYSHPVVGLCRICWKSFQDKVSFDNHIGGSCQKVIKSKIEKFHLLYETFSGIGVTAASKASAASEISSQRDTPISAGPSNPAFSRGRNGSSIEAPETSFSRTIVSSRTSKDSGYSSLLAESQSHSKLNTTQEGQKQPVDDNGNDIHETQTQYSDASSLLQRQDLQKCILAFANGLFHSLPAKFDAGDLERISSTFPFLLKAFAARLGYESNEEEQRQLMYLVYRFRREIIIHLRKSVHGRCHENELITGADNNEASAIRSDVGMCLDDKIRIWESKEGVLENDIVDQANLDELDDLDGLDDLYEWYGFDEKDIPNLSMYDRILTSAPAYQWLLSSIRAQSTLQVPGPDATARHIGDQIIRAAGRPRKLSRKQVHGLCMQFTLDWDPFLFSEEQEYDHSLSYVLAHAITLTGYGNDVQAATCESYMNQTWPETGPRLLAFLQRTFETNAAAYQGKRPATSMPDGKLRKRGEIVDRNKIERFPDRTVIAAHYIDSKLRVNVNGSIFAVAEVAEQLAWIGAALRSSPHAEDAVYSTAHITELSVDEASFSQASILGNCNIEFRTERLDDSNLAKSGNCWRGMFRNPVIVRGYPIPRRPRADTGLEVPLEMVSALTNCRKIVKFAGVTFVKGFAALLAVMQVVDDVVFWHLCYDANGDYISYEDSRIPRSSQSQSYSRGLSLDTLEMGRHIVGWTDNARNYAGAPDADYNIEWTDLPSPNSKCVLEKVSITGSASPFIPFGASIAIGMKDKPLHLGFGSGDDYMGTLFTIGKRNFVFYEPEERRAWLVDGVSAVLHLLRAYLKFHLDDSRISDCFTYCDGEIEEASPENAYTGAKAAYDVLKNPSNQKLPLYPKAPEESEERTTKLGAKRKDDEIKLKATSTNFTLKERVEQICHILLQITAYYDDLDTEAGYGWRLKKSPCHRIEGFEFMDVATRHDTLWPKAAIVHAMSAGWVHFARALHAVPLFGVGFGELLRPARIGPSCCASTASVPTGKDFLAVYGADLEEILRRGSKRRNPWRLVGNIHWHSPGGRAFESCKCEIPTPSGDSEEQSPGAGKAPVRHRSADTHPETRTREYRGRFHSDQQKQQKSLGPSDLVQVLLPTAFPQLYGRGLRSPAKVVSKGAVIFGHCMAFPLRWSLTKNVPPEEGEPDPPSVDDVTSLMDDSGIGMSNDSSGGNDSTPPNFYDLGHNPGLSGSDPYNSAGLLGTSVEDIMEDGLSETAMALQRGLGKRPAREEEAEESNRGGKLRRVERII